MELPVSRSNPNRTEPFYLIVTDHDRAVFCVEGPMTDDRSWQTAGRPVPQQPAPHRVRSGRRRPRRARGRMTRPTHNNLARVPPGSTERRQVQFGVAPRGVGPHLGAQLRVARPIPSEPTRAVICVPGRGPSNMHAVHIDNAR